jgi:hypothetical protein
MIISIVNASAIIVAQQFNPSIITQLWLVRNEILSADDFREGCISSPMVSQINSREFSLLTLPDRLQFTPNDVAGENGNLVTTKLGGIVSRLPHTPYSAIGLNFTWHLDPEETGIGEFSRSIFYRDTSLFREFDTEDARYGGYLSKNVLGCRLKLDIKPIIMSIPTRKDYLQFAFNFHLDLSGDNPVEEILSLLTRWNEAKGLSSRIVGTVQRS